MPSNKTVIGIRKAIGIANLALGTAVVALDALLRNDASRIIQDHSQSLYFTFVMGGGGAALAISGAIQYFGMLRKDTNTGR